MQMDPTRKNKALIMLILHFGCLSCLGRFGKITVTMEAVGLEQERQTITTLITVDITATQYIMSLSECQHR